MLGGCAGRPRLLLGLLAALGGLALCGLVAGLGGLDAATRDQVLDLRLQRAAVAGCGGAALAVAGLLMQGLFRNPLAGPSVLGTGAGALVGGQCVVLLGGLLP